VDATTPEHWLQLATEFSLWGSPPTLNISDVAKRIDVEEDVLRRWWMRYGFGDPGDRVIFREDDLDLFRGRATVDAFFGDEATTEFALGFGMALRQVAEAAVALFFNRLGDQEQLPLAEQITNQTDGTQMFKLLPTDVIPPILFHAFLEALEYRQTLHRAWEGEACVGFCDLDGSTSLMNSQASSATMTVLGEFEVAASQIIVRLGGRIVKFVGDEVMWTVANPADAISIGLELIEWVARHPALQSARVGIAIGEVVQRDGDLFGPTVNRAARFAARADPGAMIVDAELSPEGPSEAIIVKGFPEPLEVRMPNRLPS
jgi:adenylate cyclase